MNKHLIAFFGLMAILFTAEASFGGVMVSLSSNPVGPVSLAAGQSITVDVNVSGITDPLDYLAVTVSFDPVSLSGDPLSFLFGSIVTGGIPNVGTDSANGIYDVMFSPGSHITTDGLFFQFSLTAQSVLATIPSPITISYAAYATQSDPYNIIDVDLSSIPPIDVSVLGSSPVVPEPASWLVISVLGIGIVVFRKQARWTI